MTPPFFHTLFTNRVVSVSGLANTLPMAAWRAAQRCKTHGLGSCQPVLGSNELVSSFRGTRRLAPGNGAYKAAVPSLRLIQQPIRVYTITRPVPAPGRSHPSVSRTRRSDTTGYSRPAPAVAAAGS